MDDDLILNWLLACFTLVSIYYFHVQTTINELLKFLLLNDTCKEGYLYVLGPT